MVIVLFIMIPSSFPENKPQERGENITQQLIFWTLNLRASGIYICEILSEKIQVIICYSNSLKSEAHFTRHEEGKYETGTLS